MPTFKIDGREIPFEKGDTIIRAADRAGVDIPHYCWHPGLSVAANCRMCLVEIAPPPGQRPMMLDVLGWDEGKGDYVVQKKPKLQPACQMFAAEGMDVKSDSSDEVAKARAAVQELLLLNHPVDCPICDQAGECRLQDYWLEHSRKPKRMLDEPVHKPKAVSFGPTIVYDAERCIVCTRCVRFCEEVAKDPVLDERERGNLTEITVAPGRRLDHDYTLMTEHVCPVGALTSKDFRFQARVWFLRSARTVCPGCATGCNAWLDFDPRTETPYRHRPRENEAVNKYWMCDDGMLSYRRLLEGRVASARVAGSATTVDAAIDAAAKALAGQPASKIAFVLGAQQSDEDNFALASLARTFVGASGLFVAARPDGKADDILMHADKNPNRAGVNALVGGAGPAPFEALLEAIVRGTYSHVVVLGGELPVDASLVRGPLAKLATLVVLATHEGVLTEAASVVLPIAAWAEADGTFRNASGTAQKSEKAVAAKGDARPAWQIVAALGRALGYATDWQKLKDLRRAMTPATTTPAADQATA